MLVSSYFIRLGQDEHCQRVVFLAVYRWKFYLLDNNWLGRINHSLSFAHFPHYVKDWVFYHLLSSLAWLFGFGFYTFSHCMSLRIYSSVLFQGLDRSPLSLQATEMLHLLFSQIWEGCRKGVCELSLWRKLSRIFFDVFLILSHILWSQWCRLLFVSSNCVWDNNCFWQKRYLKGCVYQ